MTVDEVVERFRAWAAELAVVAPAEEPAFADWFRDQWKELVNRFAAGDPAAKSAIVAMPLNEQKQLVVELRSVLHRQR